MNKQKGNVKQYPTFLKAGDIADILQIGVRTAYKVMHDPDLPSFRIGKSIRVKHNDLLAWIETNRNKN